MSFPKGDILMLNLRNSIVFTLLITSIQISYGFSSGGGGSDKATLNNIMDQLGIPHDGNGTCLHSKKVLTRTDLNRNYARYVNYTRNVILENIDIEPHWKCNFLNQHIKRDTNRCLVDPADIISGLPIANKSILSVSGKIKYLGFYKKKYRYDIDLSNPAKPVAILKIHFQNTDKDTSMVYQGIKEYMQISLSKAQEVWNESAAGAFGFKFIVVDNANESHFSVRTVSSPSRGPYDTEWSIFWSKTSITHEIGHMLGLDDEYDNARFTVTMNRLVKKLRKDPRFKNASDAEIHSFANYSTSRCSNNSFMCKSSKGLIQKLHLYQIFKRSHCQKG